MKHYQLSDKVHLETFKEDAVLFVSDRDVMVTVNHAAAELFEVAMVKLRHEPFTREDCVSFLLENFNLTPEEARTETSSLLSFGLRKRIVLKGLRH